MVEDDTGDHSDSTAALYPRLEGDAAKPCWQRTGDRAADGSFVALVSKFDPEEDPTLTQLREV